MTSYNDNFTYNANIPWNGQTTPTPVVIPSMGVGYAYVPPRRKKKIDEDDDGIIAAMLLVLLDDD